MIQEADTYRERVQQLLNTGQWYAGMERLCERCHAFIPLYTEKNSTVHGGRPYYVDVFPHTCYLTANILEQKESNEHR